MQKSFIKAKETFEDRCNLIHNFKYKYFNDYTGRHNKIKVLCIKLGNLFVNSRKSFKWKWLPTML
jgi:hypothetical protein